MSVHIKKNGNWEVVAGNANNTTGVAELSALANLGTAANATQHDINVAIDSVIYSIKNIHQLSSTLPSDTYTSFPIALSNDITIGGVTIPAYSRGYFCASIDAMAILVDADGYVYICYRNIKNWNNCTTNKPNWVQWSTVADSNFRVAFQNAWNEAANYSLISLALQDGTEGSVSIQKKPGTTYGFFSCGDGNYELKHDTDGSWMVRKITV